MAKRKKNPLEIMAESLVQEWRDQGIEVTEAKPFKRGQLQATFVPRRRARPTPSVIPDDEFGAGVPLPEPTPWERLTEIPEARPDHPVYKRGFVVGVRRAVPQKPVDRRESE